MSKTPATSVAIITGIGMLGFGLFYSSTGIFPSRTGWSPSRVVTESEDPIRFRLALLITLLIGVACLVWGIIKNDRNDFKGSARELAEEARTYTARSYGAQSPDSDLAAVSIRRRAPRAQDVQIKILYCGVCHSDLHQVRDNSEM